MKEWLSESRLKALIEGFGRGRIAVLGDYFLDKYLDVDPALEETSVETGKPAHQVTAVHCSPGAAGTVVNNLAALGAGSLHAIGLIGDDGEGFELTRGLAAIGCDTEHLIRSPDHLTPTYLKPRDQSVPGLAGEHARYDTKLRSAVTPEIEATVIASLDRLLDDLDGLIVLDQVETDSTILTPAVREAVVSRAAQNERLIAWVDSRFHASEFRHMIVKCNQFEVVAPQLPRGADSAAEQEPTDDELRGAATRLRDDNEAQVFVTCGRRGVLVSDPPGEWSLVPGISVAGPIDPTGAGDSFTAGAVLVLASGGTRTEAAAVGNLVASITIECLGETGSASPRQVIERYRGR